MQREKPLEVSGNIARGRYRDAEKILHRRGDRIEKVWERGILCTLSHLRHRPVLIIGCLLCQLFFLWLPTRVLFLKVIGNTQIPEAFILEQCRACGINFGASTREIRSEKVKNQLLEKIPQLQWAGINTRGCVAEVNVREKIPDVPLEPEHTVSHIVAVRDAVLLSCTVQQGNVLCKVGQAVQQGQILVSGYTDCGLSILAARSQADIYGQTLHTVDTVTLSHCIGRGEAIKEQTRYILIIGDQQYPIPSWEKEILEPDGCCIKTDCTDVLTLPGGFGLPVALRTVTSTWYKTVPRDKLSENLLESYTEDYLSRHMSEGEILKKELHINDKDGAKVLSGKYLCRERIGMEAFPPNESFLQFSEKSS